MSGALHALSHSKRLIKLESPVVRTGKFFTERSAHLSIFWRLLQHLHLCIEGTIKVNLRNRRQTFSLQDRNRNKDVRKDKHVYQYSFKVPVNQSDFDTALSDIHNCIQMSIHQSSSQIDSKKQNWVAPIRGVERTWQTFEPGSNENPNTFQQ